MKVIIAEKPSVALSIAKIVGADTSHREGPTGYVEGNGYRVTWAFGHLVTLQTPRQMGYTSNDIPMFPEEWKTRPVAKGRDKDGKDIVDAGVKKQLKTLETLFNSAERIIVATDAGREGELIFRYIYEHLGCRTPFDRLWISSLTDEAIRKGLREIKPGSSYDNLSRAAHARSEADWLVGMNASTALKRGTDFPGTLSLGRVQTPTLGMICARYLENKNFVPTPFWQLLAGTAKNGSAFDVQSEDDYQSREAAETALQAAKAAAALKVESVEKKRSKTSPPYLYDITSLQRAANGKYGLTAEQTLNTAQSLYEKKFLSYPRTGSRFIPEDVYRVMPALISGIEAYPRFSDAARALRGKTLCRKSVNDKKVTDHHALLPTENIPGDLEGNEKKIWEMVCARALEAFGEDSIADITNVRLSAGGVAFKAHGSVTVVPGWKGVLGSDSVDENRKDDAEEDDPKSLPDLRQGETLPVQKMESVRKETKPKPVYTDSGLLGAMETCGKDLDDEDAREAMKDVGIGTPATRASMIEKLINVKYISREKKKLVPTDLGLQVWDLVKDKKISEVRTTGEWERDLALVEQGKMDAGLFNRGIKEFVKQITEDLLTNSTKITRDAGKTYRCPYCGRDMANFEKAVSCYEKRGGCGFTVWRTAGGRKLDRDDLEALLSGGETKLICGFKGKTGTKFNAKLRVNPDTHKTEYVFAERKEAPQGPSVDGASCPACGKPMADGGSRLTCTCGMTIWKTVCGVTLTEEQIRKIAAGESVPVAGMRSKAGKVFSAKLKANAKDRKVDFVFDKKK